jgi:hypothetical protein
VRKPLDRGRHLTAILPSLHGKLIILLSTMLILVSALAVVLSRHAPLAPLPDTQRGFALPTYSRDGYSSLQAEISLRQIRGTGSRWVQLTPTWYQAAAEANEIAPSDRTPSDSSIRRAIYIAHQVGLQVLLKPLVDLSDGAYRGTVKPVDRLAWFRFYRAFADHFAQLAAQMGVEELAVGTELAGVSGDRSGWLDVIKTVRSSYAGPLLYAANFDEYQQVAFWDALTLIGLDAYWQLAPQPTTDVRALQLAWRPIQGELARFAARAGRRVLFTEAGYTSQRGSTTAPWSWTISQVSDQTEQAAAYEALLASFHGQPWWAGVFWWAWDVPDTENPDDGLGYTPRGKTAEDVVRRWWT